MISGAARSLVVVVVLFSVFCCSDKSKDDLRVAEHLYAQQKYSEALVFYRRFLESNPKYRRAAEIYLRIGNIQYFSFQDVNSAMENYDIVASRWPGKQVAVTALERKANLLERQGNLRDAIGVYETLLKYPDAYKKSGDRYRYFIGRWYLKLQDYDQSQLELTEMLSEFPESKLKDRAYMDLGEANFLKRDWNEAIKYYQRLVTECPESSLLVESKFNWALSLENMGEWRQALKVFEGIRSNYPNTEVITRKIEALRKRIDSAHRG